MQMPSYSRDIPGLQRHAARALCSLCVFLFTGLAAAQDESLAALEERSFQQAVAAADPSIVRIETVGGMDLVGEVLTATGPTTGVIVSEDGYIITSRFNFVSHPATVVVTLSDERKFAAKIVAEDFSRMLTLLKIDAAELKPLPAVTPDDVEVGQWALALGRTFDPLFPNMSVGIVSAVRRLSGRATQTDAKVSPLNYGGPLIDLTGRGIGILVPLSPQGKDETAGVEWYDGGIGFAIPLHDVYAALPRMQAGESLHRGLLGIGFAEDGPLAGAAKIATVRPESPADRAGIQVGDIVTQIDGVDVPRIPLLKRALGPRYAGDTVALKVKRGDQELPFSITLAAELKAYSFPWLGILPVRELLNSPQPGVGVRVVIPETPAAKGGLQTGDVITSVKGEAVNSLAELRNALRAFEPNDDCELNIQRGDAAVKISVTLGTLPDQIPAEVRPVATPRLPEAATRPAVGRLSETLAGRELKYWAYVPENSHPEVPLGLLLWLHPAGDSMEAEVFRLMREHCDRRGILLVGPQAGDIAGWTADDLEPILDLVKLIQEKYQIDPARIAACGHGDGVSIATQLILKDRERFRGLVASSGVYRGRMPDNDPDERLEILLTQFELDGAAPIMGRLLAVLKQMKYPVVQQTLAGDETAGLTADWAELVARWFDVLDRT